MIAAAAPVDSAADSLADSDEAVALSLSLSVSLAVSDAPLVLSATATVADELTTWVLPSSSVVVLTTSTVELPATVAYAAVDPPYTSPSSAALTLTPPTSASGPPMVSVRPAMRTVPSMAVAVYLPPPGTVKAATSVREGAAVVSGRLLAAVVEGAVPFWVVKSVTSGSRAEKLRVGFGSMVS